MKGRKSQAAMEFLMTYGWAILVALIVVGVLWLIIGNPSNFVGNKFTMSDPLISNALDIQASGITIEVRNGLGESLTVTGVNITNCGLLSTTTTIANSALQTFTVTCSPTLISGDRFRGDVTISYTKTGSSITQRATGSVNGKVT